MIRYDVTIDGLPPELDGPRRVVTYHGPDESSPEDACTAIETMVRFDAVQREIEVGPLEVSAARAS